MCAAVWGAVGEGGGADRAGGILLSPLILTKAQLDSLRARELLIAQDLDREGITL